MAFNLFEIDYLQLCFSDLTSNYLLENNVEDVILYAEQVQIDKLRVNHHHSSLEQEWDSFKLNIIDEDSMRVVFTNCQKLNFKIANKIKVICKLKPRGKMILRCLASITAIENNQKFEINILNQTY